MACISVGDPVGAGVVGGVGDPVVGIAVGGVGDPVVFAQMQL